MKEKVTNSDFLPMSTSLTAIFHQTGTPFSLQSLPIPNLNPRELLIRNEYTTLCQSDIHTYCGHRKEKSPTILGHEIVGRIVEIPNEETPTDLRGETLSLGDRVTWAIFASDPNGEMAQKGIPQKGEDLFKYGHEQLTEDSVLRGRVY